jgi:hypothetical protein
VTTRQLSELNLDDDVEQVLALPEASQWTIERAGPLEVWVTLAPADVPTERFQARLAWNAYPDQAPSLKFRDPATGRLDLPSAWPQAPGFRPGSLDACVNWAAEGLALHPEWHGDRRYRWDPRGNALLKVLRLIQETLDEGFQGRHP